MTRFLQAIVLFALLLPITAYAQPANDGCISAISFGVLDSPAACTAFSGGFNQGATTTLHGTNVGATSSAPYPYIANCPVNNSSLPKDVWYSFVAMGYQTLVSLANPTGTLTEPSIAVWTGTCGSLEGVGCVSGAGTAPSVLIYQTIIGQTYYIQVAGADSTQTGAFDLSVACANNCATCLLQSYITPSVPPVNGTYNPGQTVTFCYTITQYNEITSNWLDGVTLTFGKGWDSTSLVIDSLPPSCTPTPGAYWGWFPQGDSSFSTSPPGGVGPPFAVFGPGFYYVTSDNNPCGCIDSIPGNNYGDEDAGQGTCSPTFCITLTVGANDTAGSDLSVNFATTADGQSGNYNTPGCGPGIDSGGTFYAVTSCSAPILHPVTSACGQTNGQDTAIAVGNYPPYIFHWSTGYIDTGRVSVITGLAPGIYTVSVTNNVGCVVSVRDTVPIQPPPYGGPTLYLSCPTVVDTVVMAGVGIGTWSALATNPAPTIIDHPGTAATPIRGFSTYGTYAYVWTVGFCSDTVDVIVSSRPDAGPDVSACVNGTATMAAIGTGTWSPLPTNPAPTTITAINSPTTTITGFTVGGTYTYVWSVASCTDTASVIILPFVSSASAADPVLCKYQSTTLTATAGPQSSGPFTYAWSPASDVVSPTSASTATTQLLAPTIYILTVTAAGGCQLIDSVPVAVAGASPRVSITPSDNSVCPGDTVTLTSQALTENLVYCGVTNTCAVNNNNVSIAVNNDNSTNSGNLGADCSPFQGFYNSLRVQYLFTKAELNAAGLSSGTITDISFFVKALNSTSGYDTFAVSMGCTDLDSLTDFANNLQQVLPPQYGPNAIFPNLGWTPLIFSNYYNWDGSSNIIVQVCYTIDPSVTSVNDDVSYTTTSYTGSTFVATDNTGIDGCSLNSITSFSQALNTRPNIKFGQCVPNVLTYQWAPPTALCNTCPVTQVVVTTDTTYSLTVNDNGCLGTASVSLTINPYIGTAATPLVAVACAGDSVQLHVGLTNAPPPACVQAYTVASIPYAPIAGVPDTIPAADFFDDQGFNTTIDATAGPLGIGFSFPFYCQSFDSFYVNTNGWISFVDPYPATTQAQESTAQALPPAAGDLNPQKIIAMMWDNFEFLDQFGFGGGGTASYFVSGTAPNRVLVVQYNNIVDANTNLDTTSGEIHLHEGSGVIDILLSYSTFAGSSHTTGIKDSIGLGIAAPGRNDQPYTISTPEAWRFTPEYGSPVTIGSVVWSPATGLSSATSTDPVALPPSSQTYTVTDTLIINQFTHPTQCVVHDTVQVNIAQFSGQTLTASPQAICPGDTAHLTYTSIDPIVSYSWVPAQGLSDTAIADPTATVQDTTRYIITVVSAAGCHERDSITVYTHPLPVATLPASYLVCDCAPDSTVRPTVTGGAPSYAYLWSDGTTDSLATDTSVGAVTYTLTVTDANHCSAVSNAQTITMDCPRAGITVSPVSDTIFLHDTATLTATPGQGYVYQWATDSTLLALSPALDSTHVIGLIAGHDTASLLVTDAAGCIYRTSQLINVVEFGNFALATAFTPNGDGKNDYFYPVFTGPVTVTRFDIYDRWGQLVYNNSNPLGWDGNYAGKQQPTETYMYFITLEYPDPNAANKTIQQSVQGSFQLFR